MSSNPDFPCLFSRLTLGRQSWTRPSTSAKTAKLHDAPSKQVRPRSYTHNLDQVICCPPVIQVVLEVVWQSATRLMVDDPSGDMVLRLLEPAGKDHEMGEQQFYLPHHFQCNPNDRWTTNHLVQIMGVRPGPDLPGGSIVKLDRESEQVGDFHWEHTGASKAEKKTVFGSLCLVFSAITLSNVCLVQELSSYCVSYNWQLDGGELADTEDSGTTRHTLKKPSHRKGADAGLTQKHQPCQQKVKECVPAEVLAAMDVAIGLGQHRSKSRCRIKSTQKETFLH
ncbi:hypothetical protein VOLCADRAFT_94498 [Volvox carteri f. nagariensis]|uniref:Uncharacterized protein n=1 Tax=Volvox carteri f. nagariensis TaxID=3068 RepID=D8U4Y5_VOLCA|nr:uncharacterized protein VOLCADRAFT_94498 [Volvox carteri f. nagariensis]EFJ45351.1 hypothetical protein VOLCADRAFT_94498 [Volvox carteri f. nagariensis]|eukprot:XP_002953727.1 hypothetical protein VOLCADRAFT_94498 [Volvox carteri f. nagariensis]